MNVYIGLGINGFFTGLGVITANFVFDYWKKRIKRLHKKIKRKEK